MQWVFTPDEFVHVWATETGLDYRPYPINGLRPTDTDARRPQRINTDPDLTAALMLCARPDATTLTVSGERGEDELILAFAAVAQQHGVILVARAESMAVHLCHAQAVGERLVEVIGSAPAGRRGAMREATDAVLDQEPTADRDEPGHRSPPDSAARFQRALRAPVDSRGIVTVTTAPNNPATPPTRHRTWLDVAGDGRYLLTTADQLVLTPVDDDAFADHLMRLAGLI
ncbi:ESX secretion-associated protein EspG [Nocardia sp. NEAU-G5]|uniref:ESX secretion-associated protein EspG n=1 Tax=Nocardia albiluteola TaxID=2842303 RepID=A0ABS6ARU0_9NOCA|nr:ESX secretion-associated protein EspG [Nocardia albiluteola]